MKAEDIFKQDMAVIQTVYGLSLTLGYREIANWLFDAIAAYHSCPDIQLMAVKFFMASVLILIEIRFFWASGNIRRFITRKESRPNDRKVVTVVHFPILLLHSFLLYIFCRLLSTIHEWKDVMAQGGRLVWFLVGFLALNGVWLLCLVFRRSNWEPELLWIKNNGITVLILSALMTVRGEFRPDDLPLLLSAFLLLNVNSLADLFLRADSYLAYTESAESTGNGITAAIAKSRDPEHSDHVSPFPARHVGSNLCEAKRLDSTCTDSPG